MLVTWLCRALAKAPGSSPAAGCSPTQHMVTCYSSMPGLPRPVFIESL